MTSPLKVGVATFTPKPPQTAGEAQIGSVISVNGERFRVVSKDGDLIRVVRVMDDAET